MHTLNYTGFDGQLCSCGCAMGEMDGKAIVIFVQGEPAQTSIKNVIEDVANAFLSQQYQNHEKPEVRFFEHYPSMHLPSQQWHEVQFAQYTKFVNKKGLLQSIKDLVSGIKNLPRWVVEKPEWTALRHPDAIAKLRAILQSDN